MFYGKPAHVKGNYHRDEQRRLRQAIPSVQSRQSLRCSLAQRMKLKEASDQEPYLTNIPLSSNSSNTELTLPTVRTSINLSMVASVGLSIMRNRICLYSTSAGSGRRVFITLPDMSDLIQNIYTKIEFWLKFYILLHSQYNFFCANVKSAECEFVWLNHIQLLIWNFM